VQRRFWKRQREELLKIHRIHHRMADELTTSLSRLLSDRYSGGVTLDQGAWRDPVARSGRVK